MHCWWPLFPFEEPRHTMHRLRRQRAQETEQEAKKMPEVQGQLGDVAC